MKSKYIASLFLFLFLAQFAFAWVWTFEYQDDMNLMMLKFAVNENYVYIADGTFLKKINRNTGIEEASVSLGTCDNVRSIDIDEQFVYVSGRNTSGGKIFLKKFDFDLNLDKAYYNETWVAAVVNAWPLEDYILLCGGDNADKSYIFKMNKYDFSIVEKLEYSWNGFFFEAEKVGDYVYITYRKNYQDSGVWKFNFSTMELVAQLNYGNDINIRNIITNGNSIIFAPQKSTSTYIFCHDLDLNEIYTIGVDNIMDLVMLNDTLYLSLHKLYSTETVISL